MVAGTSTPAAPDMSFMYGLGLTGAVPATGRGWAAGNASGVTAGVPATVGWANPSSGWSAELGPPTSAPHRMCLSVAGSLWLLVSEPCASP
jgi:hypothetical protein